MAVIPRTPSSLTRVTSSTATLGLRRHNSCPSLNISHDLYVADRYRPRRFHYRTAKDWDLYDEYWWDRRYYTSPFYWQTYRYAGRRYNYNDPPFSVNFYYPGIYESKYHWNILDYLDPNYWRRYQDPYQGRSQEGGRAAAAVGAPPQTPRRLRRKNVAGGSAPRPPLGAPVPSPPPERGLGRSPSGGLGGEPLATFLR